MTATLRLYLVTCETHDAHRWASPIAECPYCVVEGRKGTSLASEVLDLDEHGFVDARLVDELSVEELLDVHRCVAELTLALRERP